MKCNYCGLAHEGLCDIAKDAENERWWQASREPKS